MPPKAGPAAAGVIVRIPENVAEFYANSLQLAVTPWDVTLMFGSNVLPDSFSSGVTGLKQESRVDAIVRMSPQHAKAMVRSMAKVLEDFEKQFGEIHIPAEEDTNANSKNA